MSRLLFIFGKLPTPYHYEKIDSVSFNPDQTKALISFGDSSGSLMGGGSVYLLEKQGKKWVKIRSVGGWFQ